VRSHSWDLAVTGNWRFDKLSASGIDASGIDADEGLQS